MRHRKYSQQYRLVDGAFLVSLFLAFGTLCAKYFSFTIDDAYITFRYAKHLAAGEGIVWNLGQNPVEGYTSTLWVFVSAIPHWLGVDPVLFVKLLSVVAVIAVIGGMYVYGRYVGTARWVLVPICATIAFNPAVALLTVQGMETAAAMLFMFLAGVATLELTQRYHRRLAVFLYIMLFLGMMTRPEIVVFASVILMVLAVITYSRDGPEATARLTGWGILLLFVPGIVYMIARMAYFGYPFPNSYYIKAGAALSSGGGVPIVNAGLQNLKTFAIYVVGPISFTGVILVGLALRQTPRYVLHSLKRTAPLIVGTVAFLAVWLFIHPYQGFLWRFQAPSIPIILLGIVVFAAGYSLPESVLARMPDPKHPLASLSHDTSASVGHVAVLAVLLVASALTAAPLHLMDEASDETIRSSESRVLAGELLNEHTGNGRRMLVSESGALPYYSEWSAIDKLGLNSEHIAHNGLTQSYMKSYNPDLVMMGVGTGQNVFQRSDWRVTAYLEQNDFQLIAVISSSAGQHAYFARPSTKGYRTIVCDLLSGDRDKLEYMSRDRFAQWSPNVSAASISTDEC